MNTRRPLLSALTVAATSLALACSGDPEPAPSPAPGGSSSGATSSGASGSSGGTSSGASGSSGATSSGASGSTSSGSSGTGTTTCSAPTLAHALGHIACRRGRSVLVSRADRLLKTLRHARLDNSYDAELRKLLSVDLLIIDDFGLDASASAR